jgi:hypothetical protein
VVLEDLSGLDIDVVCAQFPSRKHASRSLVDRRLSHEVCVKRRRAIKSVKLVEERDILPADNQEAGEPYALRFTGHAADAVRLVRMCPEFIIVAIVRRVVESALRDWTQTERPLRKTGQVLWATSAPGDGLAEQIAAGENFCEWRLKTYIYGQSKAPECARTTWAAFLAELAGSCAVVLDAEHAHPDMPLAAAEALNRNKPVLILYDIEEKIPTPLRTAPGVVCVRKGTLDDTEYVSRLETIVYGFLGDRLNVESQLALRLAARDHEMVRMGKERILPNLSTDIPRVARAYALQRSQGILFGDIQIADLLKSDHPGSCALAVLGAMRRPQNGARWIDVRRLIDQIDGLKVVDQVFNADGYFIEANAIGPSPAIFVSTTATENEGRRRFTIAHELGHFMFSQFSTPPAGDEEAWCDRFAAELLMPMSAMRVELQAGRGGERYIARVFRVSREAAERRLKELRAFGLAPI